MAILTVSATRDYSADTLRSINTIQFANSSALAVATFAATQFDGSSIHRDVLIAGNAQANHVLIRGNSVDLSAVKFSSWTTGVDRLVIDGNNTADLLIGSSRNDVFRNVYGSGFRDVRGGAGDDRVELRGGEGSAGLDMDGGSGSADEVTLVGSAYVNGSFARGWEILRFAPNMDSFFEEGVNVGLSSNLTRIVGNQFQQTLRISGGADLSGITFVNWDNNVDRITIFATAGLPVIGSSQNDEIVGNNGINDRLTGGPGVDVLKGYGGNDTYGLGDEASGVDTINEWDGLDTITSAISRSLLFTGYSGIENLTLLGTGNIDGTGNDLFNILNGNAGNNTLSGGLGDDVLGGLAGVDRLIGGPGNDSYVLVDLVDTIVEAADEGTADLALFIGNTGQTYTLPTNVERLTLLFSANTNATGNAAPNIITGNTGANVLNGAGGNDSLDGGPGNDVYVLGAEASGVDTISDASGTDTIMSTVTRSLSPWNGVIENLLLIGTANINGNGSSGNNGILGNAGNNVLAGLAGVDALNGGGGNDFLFGQANQDNLTGGLGNDTFVFQTLSDSPNGALCDFVYDFDDAGDDRINLNAVYGPALTYIGTAAFTAVGQVRINDTPGNHLVVEVNLTAGAGPEMQILLLNTTLASMAANDFMLA